MPVAETMLKSWSRSRILVSTSMTLQGSSAHDVRKRFATARNCTASIDGNVWHLSPNQVTTLSSLRPSSHSLWSMVPHSMTCEESGCI